MTGKTGEYTILDSGGWVQASEGLVKYALDPRNFLDDTYIFMFESLSYDSSVHNTDGVRNIISGTFMEDSGHDLDGYDYATLLMYAGEDVKGESLSILQQELFRSRVLMVLVTRYQVM